MLKGIATINNSKVKALAGLLLVLLLGKLIFVLKTLHMGIDLVDEGSHLLMCKYPREYAINVHNFHYLISFVIPATHITVVNLRIGWLLADICGWVLLFSGGIFYIHRHIKPLSRSWMVVLFLFGGNALALSIHDRILAYNSMSNLFINTSAGLLLFGLAERVHKPRTRILFAAAFFFAGLQLFIKPTAAIAVVVMDLVLCFVFVKTQRDRLSLYIAAGLATAPALLLAFVLPPFTTWWPNYFQGYQLAKLSGYGSSTMMVFLYALPTLGILSLIAICCAIPLKAIQYLIQKDPSISPNDIHLQIAGHLFSSLFMAGFILLLPFRSFNLEVWQETSMSFHSWVLLLPNTIAYSIWYGYRYIMRPAQKQNRLKPMLILGFLLALPYVTILGSFSPIDVSLYGHILPLLLLLTAASLWVAQVKGYYAETFYYLMFTSALCAFFFVRHYIYYPTRMLAPLTQQNIQIGTAENLMVDKPTAHFLQELQKKVNRLGKFEYATHIGLQVGLVYLLDLKQPGNNFYMSATSLGPIEKMNAEFNSVFFKTYFDEISQGPILINGSASPLDVRGLQEACAEHNRVMLLADSLPHPFLEKEKPHNTAFQSSQLYIYKIALRQDVDAPTDSNKVSSRF